MLTILGSNISSEKDTEFFSNPKIKGNSEATGIIIDKIKDTNVTLLQKNMQDIQEHLDEVANKSIQILSKENVNIKDMRSVTNNLKYYNDIINDSTLENKIFGNNVNKKDDFVKSYMKVYSKRNKHLERYFDNALSEIMDKKDRLGEVDNASLGKIKNQINLIRKILNNKTLSDKIVGQNYDKKNKILIQLENIGGNIKEEERDRRINKSIDSAGMFVAGEMLENAIGMDEGDVLVSTTKYVAENYFNKTNINNFSSTNMTSTFNDRLADLTGNVFDIISGTSIFSALFKVQGTSLFEDSAKEKKILTEILHDPDIPTDVKKELIECFLGEHAHSGFKIELNGELYATFKDFFEENGIEVDNLDDIIKESISAKDRNMDIEHFDVEHVREYMQNKYKEEDSNYEKANINLMLLNSIKEKDLREKLRNYKSQIKPEQEHAPANNYNLCGPAL